MSRFIKRRVFNAKAGARGGKRPDLQNRYFRSSWEANCARVLNLLISQGQIDRWEYEPCEFQFPVKRGTRFYKPDFRVWYTPEGPPKYWEVKGLMAAKDVTALSRMSRYYPDEVILIVGKKEYAEFESLYGHLEGWEK